MICLRWCRGAGGCMEGALVSSLSVCVPVPGCSPVLPHPKAYETLWFEDLYCCIGSKVELRLTKPLKLINFSCACRNIRLISLLSSGAGAVQLPDDGKRREPQTGGLSAVCSFLPSQLPGNGRWGEQRWRAKHMQPMHIVLSCIIQGYCSLCLQASLLKNSHCCLWREASLVVFAGAQGHCCGELLKIHF